MIHVLIIRSIIFIFYCHLLGEVSMWGMRGQLQFLTHSIPVSFGQTINKFPSIPDPHDLLMREAHTK